MNNTLALDTIIRDGIQITKNHDKVDEEKTLRIMAAYSIAVHSGYSAPNELNVWMAKAFSKYIHQNMSLKAAFLMTRNREDKRNNRSKKPQDTQLQLKMDHVKKAMIQNPGDVNSVTKAAAKYICHAAIIAFNGIESRQWDSQGKACYLMRAFILAIQLGWPVPRPIELWIATACYNIFQYNSSPDDAFIVKKPRKGASKRPNKSAIKERQIILSIASNGGDDSISSIAERWESVSAHQDFIIQDLRRVSGNIGIDSLIDNYHRKPFPIAKTLKTNRGKIGDLEDKMELINTLTNWREMEPE